MPRRASSCRKIGRASAMSGLRAGAIATPWAGCVPGRSMASHARPNIALVVALGLRRGSRHATRNGPTGSGLKGDSRRRKCAQCVSQARPALRHRSSLLALLAVGIAVRFVRADVQAPTPRRGQSPAFSLSARWPVGCSRFRVEDWLCRIVE